VAHEIVVMFMIAAATAMGCILTALAVQRRLFNARHQLLVDRIVKSG
jgi:ABC-type iron transport system FetAB permease component